MLRHSVLPPESVHTVVVVCCIAKLKVIVVPAPIGPAAGCTSAKSHVIIELGSVKAPPIEYTPGDP